MASVLLTGSSRGLGLELVRQLLADSSVGTIFATARSSTLSPDLAKVIQNSDGSVVYIQLDVEDVESIKNAVIAVEKQLDGKGLDILINNAGIQFLEPEYTTNMHGLEATLRTNVIGVYQVSAAFLPLLKRGNQKKLVNITSTVGSMALSEAFRAKPAASYKISKAALNMMTVQYAEVLGEEGFTVFCVSPGWLLTDLGGDYADLSPKQGAEATWNIISKATKKDNGAFRNIFIEGSELYDGKNPPW